jgi:hypothetical protein
MMFLAWIGVNLADATLTAFSLNLGGAEINPFLGTLALTLGLPRMLLVKVLFAVAMGGVLWNRNAFRTMRLLNYSMAAVVMYNALLYTYTLQPV